jgi:hypothetical protein
MNSIVAWVHPDAREEQGWWWPAATSFILFYTSQLLYRTRRTVELITHGHRDRKGDYVFRRNKKVEI